MTFLKRISKAIKKLSTKQKVQLIAALIVTVALFSTATSLAWFSYQRRIAKVMKIDSPNVLYLNSAHREDAINFEVKGINAEEKIVDDYNNAVLYDNSGNVDMENGEKKNITHKDYVFNVTGEAVDTFTIQLAYTTNNPFSYELYAANEYTATEAASLKVAGNEAVLVEYKLSQTTLDPNLPAITGSQHHLDVAPPNSLYYKIDTGCLDTQATSGRYTGRYLNKTTDLNGDEIADGTYKAKTYPGYNNVQGNADPIYWQANGVEAFPGDANPDKSAFSRHFILRVKWDEGELDNSAKETDIIYITVKADD